MIELDADQKTPLYEQLYAALADEIRTGQRAPGTPLPGRRTMAAQQGVSVNTVDAAYQMLAAEGLAEPRPRSGFYVQKTYGMLHSRARRAPAAPAPQPPAAPQPVYDLSTGSVDTALFPARSWGRIQKELLYQRPELLQRGEMQGDAPLRTQIAEYLSVYRGVECTPEQIVVGAGIEYLLGCLAHLFSDGMAAIENPGYFRTRTVLQNSGIPCTLVDIDREGLPADALEKSGANLCYLTPSHHFPTGVTMPATRRAQLLAWAAARPGRYILEDDYDSEFRFDTRPLPSLQGMAGPDGPVVYLTTFSKSLAPGIRIACMVLPQDFEVFLHRVKLCLQDALLQFRRLRYLAELVVRHDDAIVVVVLYIIEEAHTVGGRKVLLRSVQNTCVGICRLIGGCNLRNVGFQPDNHRLVCQIQTLHLMRGDAHYQRLTGSHLVVANSAAVLFQHPDAIHL